MATTLNFFLLPEIGNKKKLRVLAVTYGDDPEFFLVARRNLKKKAEGCRRDSLQQPKQILVAGWPEKIEG